MQHIKRLAFWLAYDGTLSQEGLKTIVEQLACLGSTICSVKLTRRQRRKLSAGLPTYDVEVLQQLIDSDLAQPDASAANATVENIESSIQAQDSGAQVEATMAGVSSEADVTITQQGDGTTATDLQTDVINIDAGPSFSVVDSSVAIIFPPALPPTSQGHMCAATPEAPP